MIYFKLDELPPSVNHAYMTVKKGKATIRVLTKEGQAYKKRTAAELLHKYPVELAKFKPNKPYFMMLRFHIKGLCTKGFPTKAASRYKKLDATNRIKLLEDVLAEVSTVDDSNTLAIVIEKVDDVIEQTEVWAWSLEDEKTPFTDALLNL